MASDPPIGVYYACVLYPFHLRNLLIQLAAERRGSGAVDRYDPRGVGSPSCRNGRHPARTAQRHALAVLPAADVTDYEEHDEALALPDPNDHHVLAAAIAARASANLTRSPDQNDLAM
jgi:hypothetical protein